MIPHPLHPTDGPRATSLGVAVGGSRGNIVHVQTCFAKFPIPVGMPGRVTAWHR